VRECLSPRTSQAGSSRLQKSRRSEENWKLRSAGGSSRRMRAFEGGEPEVVLHPFRLSENGINLEAESFSLLISEPQFRPTKLEQIAPEVGRK